jgi:hypothetical protein
MGIENLLAQGVQIRPAGMERNALMQAAEFKDRQQRNALLQMQMQDVSQQRQLAIEQARQQAAQQARMEQFRQSIPSPQMQASQQALAGGGGPTMANAQRMQPVDPRMQMLHGAMQAGMGTPMDYIKEAMPAPEKPTQKVVGDALLEVGPSGVRELYKSAAKEPEEVRLLKSVYGDGTPEYQQALRMLAQKKTTHAPAAMAISYGSPVPVVGADGTINYAQPGNRPGAQPQIMAGPDGKPLQKPGEADKPLTEGQAKAVAFASRMESADKVMTDLSSKGLNKTIPGGMGNNLVGSAITAMAPADQQRLMQAKRNFINAVLRRESGAVINPDEFANAERQYFPQPGEGSEVIAQKARERRVAIEGMRADVPKGKQSEVDRIAGAGASAPTGAAVQTATNPKTGEKLQLVNGQWVPAK